MGIYIAKGENGFKGVVEASDESEARTKAEQYRSIYNLNGDLKVREANEEELNMPLSYAFNNYAFDAFNYGES